MLNLLSTCLFFDLKLIKQTKIFSQVPFTNNIAQVISNFSEVFILLLNQQILKYKEENLMIYHKMLVSVHVTYVYNAVMPNWALWYLLRQNVNKRKLLYNVL